MGDGSLNFHYEILTSALFREDRHVLSRQHFFSKGVKRPRPHKILSLKKKTELPSVKSVKPES